MATKRRSPGKLPPTLTPKQRADARRCFPIGVHVALYYARRKPPGLTTEDLLSAADEAVVLAVCTHATSSTSSALERYVWNRVRSTLKTLIKQFAERLGLRAPNDTYESQAGQAAEEGLAEYAVAMEDPRDVWQDPREQKVAQFSRAARDAATAEATGAAGHAWHMRGEEGFVLRAEYVRGMKILHDEVARLQPAHATIMELRFFRELKVAEVAKAAGVSEPTVTRMIGAAIPILRARLEARGIKDLSLLEGR